MNSRVLSVLMIIGFCCLISCSEQDSTEQMIEEKDIAFDQLEMIQTEIWCLTTKSGERSHLSNAFWKAVFK